MTRDAELIQGLKRAAERITNRTLAQHDVNRLVDLFNQGSGTAYERARRAIELFAGLAGKQIIENTAAADNLNRILGDLKQIADDWKPRS